MDDNSASVVTRRAEREDMPLVVSNWIKSQYYGSPHWSQMDYQAFRSNYEPKVLELLTKCEVELAVLADAHQLILGFIVYNGPVLHWAYTKKDYRSKGILNLLLKNKAFETVTSTTLPGNSIRKKKKLKFNPFEV